VVLIILFLHFVACPEPGRRPGQGEAMAQLRCSRDRCENPGAPLPASIVGKVARCNG
jgi:hypothetical protein